MRAFRIDSNPMPRPTSPSLFQDDSAPTKPTAGWVNAHCDGGARGNPGPAGYGALLQDDSGLVLAELSEFLGNRTNNFAEYSGLLGCLQWTLDHGHKRLRVVSDSELMVKQIQANTRSTLPTCVPSGRSPAAHCAARSLPDQPRPASQK